MTIELCRLNEDTPVTAEQLATIMLFLDALISETCSPDVLGLAAMRARSQAIELGIPEEEFANIIERLIQYSKQKQAQHPFASLFQ